MKQEEFKFQIVTPMFLGGADQQAEGIRPASIKGALRFWWRALNWARCWQAGNQNNEQALRLLHADEARLFGVSASEAGGGQGVFLMSVTQEKTPKIEQPFTPMAPGQLYLLGMGLATFKEGGKCLRNALNKGGTFTLKLAFHPKASAADTQQVKDAVRAFELLGALGSRARHGLGSVAPTTAMSRADYVTAVKALLQPTLVATTEAPFTAFSSRSSVDMSATGADALKLLDAVGREQQLHRSYGQGGKVNGQLAERNFADDHDLILDATQGKAPRNAPARAVFGLPHNYFFSSTKGKADVNYAPGGQEGRRASPLLLHIHPVSDGGYVAIHTLMPAQFLPTGGQIRIKTKSSFDVPANPNWQVLHGYLDRFQHREVIHGE
jgi:CRISPR-associated protein Cmr1